MSSQKSALPATPEAHSVQPHNFIHVGKEVLVLRRTGQDRKSHGGFQYPKGVGSEVEAKDFNDQNKCGGGLHGWPWGFGLGEGSDYELEDIWLILGAIPGDVVGELEGGWKCKIKKGTIRYEGNMKGAMDFLREGFTACMKAMTKIPEIPPVIIPAVPTTAETSKTVSEKINSKLAASGDSSQLAASGDSSKLAASGHSSKLAASGHSSKLAASGHYSKLAASGDSSQLAASGDSSKLAASGHSSKLAASGDSSQLAASGHYSKLAASGDSSQLAASGHYSKLAASGHYSAAAVAAANGQVKVGKGGAFAIAYWEGVNKGFRFLIGKEGEDGILADTWYKVEDGKLVKA